jgi:UrcA family protein
MTRFLPTAALFSIAAFAGGVFAAPAMADAYISESVTLSYDAAQVEAGTQTELVLSDLKRQARQACTYEEVLLHTQTVDKTCAADVLAKAVKTIDSDSLTRAYNLSEGFATAAIDTASATVR